MYSFEQNQAIQQNYLIKFGKLMELLWTLYLHTGEFPRKNRTGKSSKIYIIGKHELNCSMKFINL